MLAVLHAEVVIGSGWYYAPGRWPTSDGVIPWHWFWQWFRALPAFQAMRRAQLVDAFRLAQSNKEDAPRLLESLRRQIHGGD